MITEKDVREAWVSWQIAESKDRNWSHEECIRLRQEYYNLRKQFEEQGGDDG